MDITIHAGFLPHEDPDACLAFYRDRPEVVPMIGLVPGGGPHGNVLGLIADR